MNGRLLSTVALSLLLTAGVATAQSPNADKDKQAPARAPAAQQNAPAEKMAPPARETTGQSMDKGDKAGDKAAPGRATTGQATPKAGDDKPAAKGASDNKSMDQKSAPRGTTGQAPAAKSGTDANKADSKSDMNKGATTSPQQNQGAAPGTTGQGAAAGQAKLTTEQQTKITTSFKSAKIESVPKSQINVSISVGTRLPSTLHFVPIPAEVVTVYPQWRGYYVILVDGQYIIVEPRTHEIVYIIV